MSLKTILTTIWLFIFLVFIFSISFASAITINDVSQGELFPGEASIINIELKNNLDEDVEDVSFILIFENRPFISLGSSEKSYDEFDKRDKKSFEISIKASQDIVPGDYNIPYTIKYFDKSGKEFQKNGTIGIVVGARTEIDFNVEMEKNIVGESGTITLKIINKGLGDVKFVNIKIIPNGFSVLGSESDYIGNIDSDDFETATFNVKFDGENARLVAVVNYKDFNNVEQTENINQELTVYTREEALKLGIIKRDKTLIYIISVAIVVILWLIYRTLRKRLNNKSKS